jgi:hypothetical protein
MTLDQEIDSLAAKIAELRNTLASVRAQHESLLKQRATAEFNVKPGSKVISSNGKIGIVEDMRYCGYGRPWLIVRVLKKGGLPSACTQTFYHWELVP